jgi:hypothetical protein
VLVAHTCNPSYSGSRDQEDRGSESALANSLWDTISKKTSTKTGWRSGSGCRSWVQTPVEEINIDQFSHFSRSKLSSTYTTECISSLCFWRFIGGGEPLTFPENDLVVYIEKPFYIHVFITLTITAITSILEMRTLKLREVKQLSPYHGTSSRWNHNLIFLVLTSSDLYVSEVWTDTDVHIWLQVTWSPWIKSWYICAELAHSKHVAFLRQVLH